MSSSEKTNVVSLLSCESTLALVHQQLWGECVSLLKVQLCNLAETTNHSSTGSLADHKLTGVWTNTLVELPNLPVLEPGVPRVCCLHSSTQLGGSVSDSVTVWVHVSTGAPTHRDFLNLQVFGSGSLAVCGTASVLEFQRFVLWSLSENLWVCAASASSWCRKFLALGVPGR